MRDVISTAILNSQIQRGTTGKTRWEVTFVNNQTWVGPIEKLGEAYVLYDDRASIYFCANQVIYLTVALSDHNKHIVRTIQSSETAH